MLEALCLVCAFVGQVLLASTHNLGVHGEMTIKSL